MVPEAASIIRALCYFGLLGLSGAAWIPNSPLCSCLWGCQGLFRPAVVGRAMVGSPYLVVISGFPEVSGEAVECQAPGDTEASWTGTLVTGSLFLVLLTHPNPRNALMWLTKIKHYTFSYFK